MVLVCLPSDVLSQHLPSYLGFSYLGYLTWGISSRLLQQSTAAAPYLGWGVSSHSRPSSPWTWSSSSWPQSSSLLKASGGDGIPVELFQILKDDAVKVLHSICQQIWKIQLWPQDWKRSVFIPIPKKGNPKECSNYHTVARISQTSKVMLKILQARLQQYVNWELRDVQAGFRKGRETRDQIANIHWIIEKAREFQKNIYFCFIDYAKAFDCVITINCGKFWRRWESQTTWPASWETCMHVRKQQLELDMGQQTGSK